VLTCGPGCGRHQNPEDYFNYAQHSLRRGDLVHAQQEAEQGYKRFGDSNPELAAKFRNLQAEALLLRGMYLQALTLLQNDPIVYRNQDLVVETLTLTSAVQARLHHFDDAQLNILRAEEVCRQAPVAACGGVFRGRGILALQQGQPATAKRFFEQTLDFSRFHHDQFLEATALLNLGLGALQQHHYDEAIDWTDAAYKIAAELDAGTIATKALGNLGWAYFNLGDSEKSLNLSLEAEKRAVEVGDVIDQLSWITNAGYVYEQQHQFSRAKDSYEKALELARKTEGQGDIYNALRALALVFVQSGELEQARVFSDEAMAIAQKDHNRMDELYPLLVKGLAAAQVNDAAVAEEVFRTVEHDAIGNAALKWRAQHSLGQLYENQNRRELAGKEYRAALSTFESARLSLTRSDSKLPFSTNAALIYDDYIHFLVAQGRPDEALRWADYSRARSLSEGLGLLSTRQSSAASQQDQFQPAPLDTQSMARRAGGTLLFYWLGEKQSYLWAVTPKKTQLFTLPPGPQIEAAVRRYRAALTGPQNVLESGGEDGLELYRTLIAPAESLIPKNGTVYVLPDGSLNNLNFETLIVSSPKPHFWIEDAGVVNASSLRVLDASFAGKPLKATNLLLIGNSVAASKDYPELSKAADQMASVARHFPAGSQRVFDRDQATPSAYLQNHLDQYSHIHFVAHGTASRLSPLDSAIVLSKEKDNPESFKLYARDIIHHHLRADLVTISACYGAGERQYSGEGLVGLAWAFLRAGSRNVIAALWEVTDASTDQLMDRFYDELSKGASPDVALRTAKLALLRGSAFHNPFYWAPFQLYR
jgi:CHAT domain-containing protein